MSYSIHIQNYDGPMDLLLDLINKKKLDIVDISISEMTDGFIEYIEERQRLNLDVASEFVHMASRLLEIKSRYTLYMRNPKEDEVDPREDLLRQIEEYRIYKEVSIELSKRLKEYDDRYYRPQVEIFGDTDEEVDLNIDMETILNALPMVIELINKKKEDIDDIKEEKLKSIVKNRVVSVESKMKDIRNLIMEKERIDFFETLSNVDRAEIIATFLSILELIKLKEVHVNQSGDKIEIIRGEADFKYEDLSEEDLRIEKKANNRYESRIRDEKK